MLSVAANWTAVLLASLADQCPQLRSLTLRWFQRFSAHEIDALEQLPESLTTLRLENMGLNSDMATDVASALHRALVEGLPVTLRKAIRVLDVSCVGEKVVAAGIISVVDVMPELKEVWVGAWVRKGMERAMLAQAMLTRMVRVALGWNWQTQLRLLSATSPPIYFQ
ncbi:hypothetical protein GGF32_004775 [Allomyces javanicus]|nr:hypothetical protein GGF32_004775 [Allomyces javanicus]